MSMFRPKRPSDETSKRALEFHVNKILLCIVSGYAALPGEKFLANNHGPMFSACCLHFTNGIIVIDHLV